MGPKLKLQRWQDKHQRRTNVDFFWSTLVTLVIKLIAWQTGRKDHDTIIHIDVQLNLNRVGL